MIKTPSTMPMQEGMKPQEITPSLANDRREDITRPSLKDSPLGKLLEGEVFNPSDEPRSPYDHERPSLKDSPLGKQLEGEKINPAGTDGPGSSELPSLRNSPLGKSLEKELAQAEDCTPEAGQPVPEQAESLEKEQEQPEKETRPLTLLEKAYLKHVLGWTDIQLAKCTIDADGVIHYRTDNCHLEGKTEENGVPYERKRVTINGVTIEGVFPVFDSKFDTYLPKEHEKSPDYARYCNEQLKAKVLEDPEFAKQFTQEQLDAIMAGKTPKGYQWHHNEEKGKMQLVKVEDHDKRRGGAAHTGGNALWGNKTAGPDTTSA